MDFFCRSLLFLAVVIGLSTINSFYKIAVFEIADFTEAIEKINHVRYGLTASIFTRDINLAMLALEKIQAGCCYVNAPTFGSEPHLPFGGWKQSGNGTREPGTQAMDVFSEWKTLYLDYSGVTQNSQYRMKKSAK